MARLRYTDVIGTIGSGGLTNSATSHTFTAPLTYSNGATVPTLAGVDYFMLSVLTSAGAVREVIKVTAYNSGTGAATIVRAQEGTTGQAHTSGDKVTLSAYPSDFGGLIAYTRYVAGSFTTLSTTSTTPVDVDATNLVVTFTAPPSGIVQITLNGYCSSSSTTSAQVWCLRDGSSLVTASEVQMMFSTTASERRTAMMVITGLTPGTSYTYKWGWYKLLGTGTMNLLSDVTLLPPVMLVHAVAVL